MTVGLSEDEAARRLQCDGPNELPISRPRGVLRLAREVASEPMFLLLVACGGIYMALGDAQEALMLLGFVFVVMGISFFQQRRSERALDALRDLSSPQALVLRDSTARRVAARELVVGDMVLLAEGDRVPADMDLVEAASLAIDESLLTGESVPVAKDAASSPQENDNARAFSGTLVTRGTGRGWVTATGERSALGRIGQSLAGIAVESTPIQRETHRVVKQVAAAGLSLAVVLAVAYGITQGDWLHGVLAGLTFAMASGGPYALPGAWRMAAGAREGPRQEHSRDRAARRNHRAVRGQDGHPDCQPDDREAPVVRGGGLRPAAIGGDCAAGGTAWRAGVRRARESSAGLRSDGVGHRSGRAAPAQRHRAPACRVDPDR